MSDLDTLFETLRRTLPQVEVGGRRFYVVEGDLRLDALQLRRWCAARVEQRPSGARIRELIGHANASGQVIRWAPGVELTWCCLASALDLPDQATDRLRDATRLAAADWQATCGVRFRHVAEADGADTLQSAGCVFGVRFQRQPGYLAVAFFPDAPPETREILVDPVWLDPLGYDPVGVMRHELGHVLGFRHEHLSDQAPADCRAIEDLPFVALSDYDPTSVMHYPCGGGAYGDPMFRITEDDAAAAQAVYGPPLDRFDLREP